MEWIFIPGNSVLRNVISGNNFLEYDILGVFGMQIEFSIIFDKFPKIPLMEVAAGGRLPAAASGKGRWL